jgi:hypothetical protein
VCRWRTTKFLLVRTPAFFSLLWEFRLTRGPEKRARLALRHLEFAAQAGLKDTFVDLYSIHAALAKLYKNLREQTKGIYPRS